MNYINIITYSIVIFPCLLFLFILFDGSVSMTILIVSFIVLISFGIYDEHLRTFTQYIEKEEFDKLSNDDKAKWNQIECYVCETKGDKYYHNPRTTVQHVCSQSFCSYIAND